VPEDDPRVACGSRRQGRPARGPRKRAMVQGAARRAGRVHVLCPWHAAVHGCEYLGIITRPAWVSFNKSSPPSTPETRRRPQPLPNASRRCIRSCTFWRRSPSITANAPPPAGRLPLPRQSLHFITACCHSPGRVHECVALPARAAAGHYPEGAFEGWAFCAHPSCNAPKPPGTHHCSTVGAALLPGGRRFLGGARGTSGLLHRARRADVRPAFVRRGPAPFRPPSAADG
jgi:hypothetical protein